LAQNFRKIRITSRLVDALKPGECVGDTDLPGFFVRRQQEARVYFVRKHVRSKRHFVTIGQHGREGWTERRARDRALEIIAALRQGLDPSAERAAARGIPTLQLFAETFLQNRAGVLKPGTLANYRSLLRRHIAPRDDQGRTAKGSIGKILLDQLTHQDVAGLHGRMKDTPRAANHVLDFISSLYSEAQAHSLVPEGFNPAKRVKRYTVQARQRFLSQDELARLGDVLAAAEEDGDESPYAIAAIRLLILTGCRRDEILTARWEWVDFERGLLNLPDSKTGAKSVYLNAAALDVLRTLPRVAGNPFIIVGGKEGQRWVNLRKVWTRIRDRAELQPTTGKNGKLQPVRLHDLRHSFASLLASGGASLPVIGKLLGHASPQTTARYAHLAEHPLRNTVEGAGMSLGRSRGEE
jgi:integrase